MNMILKPAASNSKKTCSSNTSKEEYYPVNTQTIEAMKTKIRITTLQSTPKAGTLARDNQESRAENSFSATAALVMPNPSLKRSANGRPPAPGRWYAVHFHRPGAGVLPSSPT